MCHHYRGNAARNANWKPEWDNEFSIRSNMYQLMLPDEGFYPLGMPPIVRLNERGDREMVAAQWGLLPYWWKPSDKAPKRTTFQRKCFNARCEDVHVKPTYREAFKRRRCLMPADEFFEKGHYFHFEDHRTFAFAALWERWQGGDGEKVESCTLLTTEANELVRAVGHPRMPVILTGEAQYARWLNPELTGHEPFESLFTPYNEAEMRSYPATA